jgi:type II secretory pathway pseudopilin PulG
VHHAVRNHGRRGAAFTLTESLAVIVILSVAFPPMLWAIRRGHEARVLPARFSVARWLAAEMIEDIIADRSATSRGYAYLTSANYPAEASVAGFPAFSRSVSFTETGPDLTSSGSGYMRVTVTVSFADGAGLMQSFPLSTVLTNY